MSTQVQMRLLTLASVLAGMLATPGCERTTVGDASAGVLKPGQRPPNIVFIVVDTLRADRLGPYGSRDGLCPFADSLAAEGVTFEQCVSAAPWTLPSVASLFTSYYPSVHKTTQYVSPTAQNVQNIRNTQGFVSVLPDEEFTTLAEALGRIGYECAGVSANRFVSAKFGFAQGFDYFYDKFEGDHVPGDEVHAQVAAWLEQRTGEQPFFLYVHYMDVHGPYNAKAEYMAPLLSRVEARSDKRALTPQEFGGIKKYLNVPPPDDSDPGRFERLKGYWDYWAARYDAGVVQVDHWLGALRDALRAKGLWDEAYVVFLSDHGEELCEHGTWDHGYTLHSPETHVPLILRWPGMLPAGKRVAGVVRSIDIMPTLFEQMRVPATGNLQGASLLPHIQGQHNLPPIIALSESLKGLPVRAHQAIVRGEWKLLRREQVLRGPDGRRTGEVRVERLLYNTTSDPLEQHNVAAAHADLVRELERLLDQSNAANDVLKPNVQVKVTAGPDLRGLGYVGGAPDDEEQPATAPSSASSPAASEAGGGP
ncbi:MAG: sulfatase [Phycisphaerae bacterium]|jgi:arylsulfatase A-like enzyme